MKKTLLTIILMIACSISVSAKTITNYYGVEMEEEQYSKLIQIYNSDYVYFLTSEEYNDIKNHDLSKIEIKTITGNEYEQIIKPFSNIQTTEYKELKIVNNSNVITLLLNWKKNPVIRSYDAMGIRYAFGVTLSSTPSFKQYYTLNGARKSSSTASYNSGISGFGYSFLLSEGNANATSLSSSITFKINGNGTIYGTYQHATSNISSSDSSNFIISSNGLGNVLLYPSNITNKFDDMKGVNITI